MLDFAAGCARIAGARFQLAAAGATAVRLGGPAGVVLRPLRFGERSWAVQRAAGAASPAAALGGGVRQAATVEAGTADELAAEIVALLLAGAEIESAPFDEVALAVAGSGCIGLTELLETEASVVDRMALTLVAPRGAADGWTSITLMGTAEPAGEDEGLGAVRDALADRLLERARVRRAGDAPEEPLRTRPLSGAVAPPPAARDEPRSARAASRGVAGGHVVPAPLQGAPRAAGEAEDRARAGAALVARAQATPDGGFTWCPAPGVAEAAKPEGAPPAAAAGAGAGSGHVAPGAQAAAAWAAPRPARTAAGAASPARPAMARAEAAPPCSTMAYPQADHAAAPPRAVQTLPPQARMPGALGDAPPGGRGDGRRWSSFAAPRRPADHDSTAPPGVAPADGWTGGGVDGAIATTPAGADELAALLHDEADLRGLPR